jgi:hypothetical protein
MFLPARKHISQTNRLMLFRAENYILWVKCTASKVTACGTYSYQCTLKG